MKKYYKRFVITLLIALVLGILPTNGLQAAKKVKLNVRKLSVTVKKTKTLKVQNTKKKVKWTIISGKKFVKLKSKKKTSVKVAGIKKGKAKVQAKVGKKKYVCKVTVKNAKKKTVKQTPKPSDGMEKGSEGEKTNTDKTSIDWKKYTTPGLYNNDTGKLEKSWETLINEDNGIFEIDDQGMLYCGTESISGMLILSNKIAGIRFDFCKNLRGIYISSSVINIDEYSFGEYSNLSTIIVDPKNKVYDSRKNCNAIIETSSNKLIKGGDKTIIPPGVKSIGGFAFSGCNGLKSIIIPVGVTSIEWYAFCRCRNLKDITIPSSVESIDVSVFEETPWLEKEGKDKDFVIINGILISYGRKTKGDIEIPKGVKKIEASAFFECNELTGINIPDGVTKIGSSAFQNCHYLESAKLPDSLKSIESSAFLASALSSINIPAGVKTIGSSVFVSTPWLEQQIEENDFVILNGILISYGKKNSGTIRIPYNVESIAGEAFLGCTDIKNIVIPDNVKQIGDSVYDEGVFAGCDNLISVDIPNGITRIEENSFKNCISLKNIDLPESLKYIGEGAFFGCSSLVDVSLPDNIETIGTSAFEDCERLERINIPRKLREIDDMLFCGCSNLYGLNVPDYISKIGKRAFEDVPLVIYRGNAIGCPWGALEVQGLEEEE